MPYFDGRNTSVELNSVHKTHHLSYSFLTYKKRTMFKRHYFERLLARYIIMRSDKSGINYDVEDKSLFEKNALLGQTSEEQFNSGEIHLHTQIFEYFSPGIFVAVDFAPEFPGFSFERFAFQKFNNSRIFQKLS